MTRNDARTLAELQEALPPEILITDSDALQSYRWDRGSHPGPGTPLVVVRAQSTEQVQEVVRVAARNGTPIVPRGAGTSLSGGSTAIEGGITLCLEDMNDIAIDTSTLTARVGPGALNAAVKAAAAEEGLWYPPDPASYAICTIGGNVATNAGGLCCVKYGVTTDYVLGMTVVLADARVVTLGGLRIKDVAGYSLMKLFTGSEGTLGIITEVLLRLIPAQNAPLTLVGTFGELDQATGAVLAITREMRPSMLEFMDQPTLAAVEDMLQMGLDSTAEAILIAQSDEAGAAAGAQITRVQEIMQANGARSCLVLEDPDEAEKYIAARRASIPAIERMGPTLMEDVGVSLPKLGDLVTGVAAIAKKRDVMIGTVAHAGDGNTHPLILVDPSDPEQEKRAQLAYGEVMELAISLGGTITGEHGVGRVKQPWLESYVGADVLDLNHRIKHALDPQGILNPGCSVVLDAPPTPMHTHPVLEETRS